jgi:hypothetical protein
LRAVLAGQGGQAGEWQEQGFLVRADQVAADAGAVRVQRRGVGAVDGQVGPTEREAGQDLGAAAVLLGSSGTDDAKGCGGDLVWPAGGGTGSDDARVEAAGQVEDCGPGIEGVQVADLGYAPVRFREDLRSRMPQAEETGRLEIAPGTPVVDLIRLAVDASGTPVEVNKMTADASAYVFRYEFSA